MIKNWFRCVMYVRVRRNRFSIRNVVDQIETEVSAVRPFTSERLLVGDFTHAQVLLKEGMEEVVNASLFAPSPIVVIHPLQMLEGGLSQVEERVLRELAAGAGARRAIVWVGKALSDQEVLDLCD